MDTDGAYTGADLFLETLEQYGVSYLFGNPGTTELPIMKAVADSDVEYVLGLHEDIAVGMAAGYASTRRYHAHRDPTITPVGVVNLHIAPGVAHGLGNLQNAWSTGSPIVVTAGNHSTDFRHEEPILGGDLVALCDQYTKWAAEVTAIGALSTMLRRAFRVALTPPTGPVFLSLPMDVMLAETADRPERLGAIPNSGQGDPEQIAAAADLLAEASDPVLILGDHVARSGLASIEAAVSLAETSGAAVYSEMITTEINYPPSNDQWVSFIPPDEELGREFMDGDVLVFVGCSTNTMYIPYEGELVSPDASLVHVSDDPWEVGKNHPADVAVIGDPGLVMQSIAERIRAALPDEPRGDQSGTLEARKDRAREALQVVSTNGSADEHPTKAALVDALREVAPDAYVINESNTSKYALLTRWPLEPEHFFALKFGGLGYGLPATLGAAIAAREWGSDQPVVGFIGDGSYLYYPQTMHSAARYDLDLTIVIPNNRNYRILKDGMLKIYGGTDEDYEFVGMDLHPPVDIPANAESHGATGVRVSSNSELEPVLHEAIDDDAPWVVDVLVRD